MPSVQLADRNLDIDSPYTGPLLPPGSDDHNLNRMSQLEVLSAYCDLEFDVVSCSPSKFSRSFKESILSGTLNGVLSTSPNVQTIHDTLHHGPVTSATERDDLQDDDIAIPGLPPLLRGHSSIHLRNGVLHASELLASGEVDAEKAFFVADLSYVYRQHERWKKNLPEVEPFYGK